ncbi:hypothetical protein F01_560006 [Burkholderia cenocepacia]|nr:hypothetical protein F01_560006 [Burkholderia cenocepacia]
MTASICASAPLHFTASTSVPDPFGREQTAPGRLALSGHVGQRSDRIRAEADFQEGLCLSQAS